MFSFFDFLFFRPNLKLKTVRWLLKMFKNKQQQRQQHPHKTLKRRLVLTLFFSSLSPFSPFSLTQPHHYQQELLSQDYCPPLCASVSFFIVFMFLIFVTSFVPPLPISPFPSHRNPKAKARSGTKNETSFSNPSIIAQVQRKFKDLLHLFTEKKIVSLWPRHIFSEVWTSLFQRGIRCVSSGCFMGLRCCK